MSGQPCPACGHDALAAVSARYTFVIEREPKSLNAHSVNAGAARFAYKRDREAWQMHMRVERVNHRIPLPVGRRRVTLTRLYSGRQREWDGDNWAGGAKPIVDAMVREHLLIDDTREFAEVQYKQERIGGAARGVRVEIEVLA